MKKKKNKTLNEEQKVLLDSIVPEILKIEINPSILGLFHPVFKNKKGHYELLNIKVNWNVLSTARALNMTNSLMGNPYKIEYKGVKTSMDNTIIDVLAYETNTGNNVTKDQKVRELPIQTDITLLTS